MGLGQKLLAIKFDEIKNVEDYPKKIRLLDSNSWNHINENGQKVLRGFNVVCFKNINILQGYFENKYDIKNYEFVQVSNEDIDYLINICDNFLQYFSKNFIQEAKDYKELSSYEYAKKYEPNYLDDLNENDKDITDSINNLFFCKLNKKLRITVNGNKECEQIINEILPVTGGLFHDNDKLTIHYLLKILGIKEIFKCAKKFLMNKNKEKIYYHCWY